MCTTVYISVNVNLFFLCIRESQLSVTQANTFSFTFVLKWNNFSYL